MMKTYWTLAEARAAHQNNGGWLLDLGQQPFRAVPDTALRGTLSAYPGATSERFPGGTHTILRPAWGVTDDEDEVRDLRGDLDDYSAWRERMAAAGYDESAEQRNNDSPTTRWVKGLEGLSEEPLCRAAQIALAALDEILTAGNLEDDTAATAAYDALQTALADAAGGTDRHEAA